MTESTSTTTLPGAPSVALHVNLGRPSWAVWSDCTGDTVEYRSAAAQGPLGVMVEASRVDTLRWDGGDLTVEVGDVTVRVGDREVHLAEIAGLVEIPGLI